jgi:hypothetical protein
MIARQETEPRSQAGFSLRETPAALGFAPGSVT